MKQKKLHMSLRNKILLILLALPFATLLGFASISLSTLSADKLAYVFDSLSFVSRTLALQIRSEVEKEASLASSVLNGFDIGSNTFSTTGQSLFNGVGHFQGVWVYKKDSSDLLAKSFKESFSSDSQQRQQIDQQIRESLVTKLLEKLLEQKIVLDVYDINKNQFLLGISIGEGSGVRGLFLLEAPKIASAFRYLGAQSLFLVSGEGRVVLTSDPSNPIVDRFATEKIFLATQKNTFSQSTFESKTSFGESVMVSLADLGIAKLKIFAVMQKSKAFAVINNMVRDGILFLAVFLAAAFIVAIFSSRRLTDSLNYLLEATKDVSKGNFDVQVKIATNDEIGNLGASFNRMTAEVKKLISDREQKIRMEAELETAMTVQETLLPPSEFIDEVVEISGHYQAASECGGDFWHYFKINQFYQVWIGDAVGHGVGAALMTSAARSAAAVIERLGISDPEKAMDILNNCIFESSKGAMWMTFFVGVFDSTTSEFNYCCASHNFPFLFPKMEGGRTITKKDVVPLGSNNGPALGRDPRSIYKAATCHLNPGDQILFFTDGLVESKNTSEQMFGDVKLVKSMVSLIQQGLSSTQQKKALCKLLNEFTTTAPQDDDITFFSLKIKPKAGSEVV